jgi:hypothetical protein
MVREGDPSSASNYLPIHARLAIPPSPHVAVYIDERDAATLPPELVPQITDALESDILPTFAQRWGLAHDVDGDGRVAVLLSSWLNRLGSGRLAADGFVRGADFDPNLASPYSNHGDLIYLNPRIPTGAHLRTVLAHEYAHAAAISRKNPGGLGASGPVREEEGWLDEAIAHLVEDEFQFSRSNLDARVQAFLADPARYQLVVRDYYAANLFRSHGNRGSTYLFLRWCADRAGPALIDALIASPSQGVANLEAATHTPFSDLFRAWSVDLFFHNPVGGPRFESVRPVPDAAPIIRHCAGTSSAYFVVDPSPDAVLDVQVDSPPESWQVTAVPLPDDHPALTLTARTLPDAPDATDPPSVRLLVRNDGREALTLESLSLIPISLPIDGRGPRPGDLDANTWTDPARSFSATQIAPGGSLASGPLRLPDDREPPLAIRLTARDHQGRPAVSWSILPRPSPAP